LVEYLNDMKETQNKFKKNKAVMEFVVINRERKPKKKLYDVAPSQQHEPTMEEETELVKQEREEVRLKLYEKLKKFSEKKKFHYSRRSRR